MTALLAELVVNADLAVKHDTMSPGWLEDNGLHTHTPLSKSKPNMN